MQRHHLAEIGPIHLNFTYLLANIAALTAHNTAKITTKREISVDSLDLNTYDTAKITIRITTKQLDVKSSGASTVTLAGSAYEQHVTVTNSAQYVAQKLKSNIISINASGAPIAHIWAVGTLTGNLSGATSLYYDGDPVENVRKSDAAHSQKIPILN